MKNKRASKVIARYLLNIVTICIVVVSIFPLVWLISTALKTQLQAFQMPPVWIFKPNFQNFQAVLQQGDFLTGYLNSLIVASGTTIVSMIFGVTTGYALSRTITRFGRFMGVWIILARMAPPMGFALPLYLIFRHIALLDTYTGLILVYMTGTLPFVTWLMMGFFKRLPIEIEEAAKIDGCSRLQTLIKVVLPSSTPGLATCAIFSFIAAWNEFFYAIIISGNNTRTAPIEIQGFISFAGTNWGQLSAAGVLVILPVLAFALFVQRGLVTGLTGGALK